MGPNQRPEESIESAVLLGLDLPEKGAGKGENHRVGEPPAYRPAAAERTSEAAAAGPEVSQGRLQRRGKEMKPAVDEMFPEGAGPYVDLDEVRRAAAGRAEAGCRGGEARLGPAPPASSSRRFLAQTYA